MNSRPSYALPFTLVNEAFIIPNLDELTKLIVNASYSSEGFGITLGYKSEVFFRGLNSTFIDNFQAAKEAKFFSYSIAEESSIDKTIPVESYIDQYGNFDFAGLLNYSLDRIRRVDKKNLNDFFKLHNGQRITIDIEKNKHANAKILQKGISIFDDAMSDEAAFETMSKIHVRAQQFLQMFFAACEKRNFSAEDIITKLDISSVWPEEENVNRDESNQTSDFGSKKVTHTVTFAFSDSNKAESPAMEEEHQYKVMS